MKFKVGDTIICPTAEKPGPCYISGIDLDEKKYVFEYGALGEIHTSIRFESEPKWKLVSSSITKSNIMDLICQSVKDGYDIGMTGVDINEKDIKEVIGTHIYTEWKKNLR
tara:strand:- start:2793 stop:3122 length:330 start_codon:yes stop_codon:yes gene_type:complete